MTHFFLLPETMNTEIKQKIHDILENTIGESGYIIFSVEMYHSSGRRVLSITLDRESGGISLDQCIGWNKRFSDALETELPDLENYIVEVSSPGLDRKLISQKDFEWAMGKIASICFKDDHARERQQTVRLLSLEKQIVSCEPYPDGDRFDLPFEKIIHARLKPIIK